MESSTPLVEAVVRAYLESRDFNGVPAGGLETDLDEAALRAEVRRLVSARYLEVITPRFDINPSIKRLPVMPPVEAQLGEIDDPSVTVDDLVLYPHPTELAKRVDRSAYDGRPYALALALGEPQLGVRAFDLSVLEQYRNDPRYRYECDDVHGSLCVRDEAYVDEKMPERDKVILNTFGFGYDEQLGRAVVTFNRYLADLTPEHQRRWQAYELTQSVRVHPDFFRTQVLGDWPEAIAVCEAFFMELKTINAMAEAMGRPGLFREVGRPKRFGFLVRPTSHEFEQFVHLLDKVMSDNINRKFFLDDVSFEREEVRSDGRVQVHPKGTIQVLDEWMRSKVRLEDWSPFDEAISIFKNVRKLRQQPAHAITSDAFDQKYFRDQRKLIVEAYGAVCMIRQMLALHPKSASVRVDPHLREGKIRTY